MAPRLPTQLPTLTCTETMVAEQHDDAVEEDEATYFGTLMRRAFPAEFWAPMLTQNELFMLDTIMRFSRVSAVPFNVILIIQTSPAVLPASCPALPMISFEHSIFDNTFIQNGQQPPGVADLFGDDPPGEDEDDDADKENWDPNGHSEVVALGDGPGMPPRDAYFDVQVVTELEQLGRAWRDAMNRRLGN